MDAPRTRPRYSVTTHAIGRLALYSGTAAALCLAGTAIVSVVWLALGADGHAAALPYLRASLVATLASGFVLFVTLFLLHRFLVPPRGFMYRPIDEAVVHVGLTAYNDELSIGQAVQDFKASPHVDKVIVVDNNSRDGTSRVAREAGADRVVTETIPGYGSCCMRVLAEAAEGADVIVLCEGDGTFRGADVRKLLAYLENSDLVLGTRSTQELRESVTQMDWLINPANQIVAKLIQVRFWGTRLTDVGCTYRAIRKEAYRELAPHLSVRGNHFSPHMYIEALRLGMRVIEVPVTFAQRIGLSKGVGNSRIKAARVAIRMLGLIYRA